MRYFGVLVIIGAISATDAMAQVMAFPDTLGAAVHEPTGANDGKTANNTKKKKKRPKSSVKVNSKGAKVKTGGKNGSVAIGPNGPSASIKPGGGPVRIGIGPNGKPKFSIKYKGGR